MDSSNFSFSQFEKKPEVAQVEKEKKTRQINFQDMPEGTKELLNNERNNRDRIEKYLKEEPVPAPIDNNNFPSYLNLVLSPNLKDLELMIRGLEYVKRFNPISGKDEIVLRRIPDHPLNEYGINKIMEFLKIYSSPEIKLGRKKPRDYYLSVQQVGRDVVRLIYKNLKNFGMDTQVKQRSAKTFALAIIEFVDSSYSRSIEGKENDLSRATEFKIEGNVDTIQDPAKLFNRDRKENFKN